VGLFIYLVLQYFFSNDEWFIILSYLLLVPQIIHNVRLGMRPSFELYYIFGYVASRILLPIYERGCPENLFRKRQLFFSVVVFLVGSYIINVNFIPCRFCFCISSITAARDFSFLIASCRTSMSTSRR
jgi:hypothetical protein